MWPEPLEGPEPLEWVGPLRADLIEVGYRVDDVQQLLGDRAAAALHREQPGPAELVTARSEAPLAVVVRLFGLGLPVPWEAIEAIFHRTGLELLAALGLAAADGDQVRALADLRPYADERHDWWLASDLSEVALGGPLPQNHVLGVGPASTTLATWTPRPRVGRALDLGTGSGAQALHLLDHADAVVATDTSPRALRYARFNADLNAGPDPVGRPAAIELRRGSLFEPVAGERFDLIVSNPPFVITPRIDEMPAYEYRDGGMTGDALVARIVAEAADHLNPGGLTQLLANWEIPRGSTWQDSVGSWLDGTGLDAFVVQRDIQDAAEYADTWARDGGTRDGSTGYPSMLRAWLDDFDGRDVEAVGFGVLTLQRPTASRPPWRRLVEHNGPVASPMGPAVLAIMAAHTALAEGGTDLLRDTAWRVAPDVTEERHGRPGAADPTLILLRQGGGLGRVVRVDTATAALVSVCDGELSAGQAMVAIATLLDQDLDELIAAILPTLAELVGYGFLVA